MNNQLEQAVMYALAYGSIQPDQVKPHLSMFSKMGKGWYQSTKWLIGHGQNPPFTTESLKATCIEHFGTDPAETDQYSRDVENRIAGKEILSVLQGADEKLKMLEMQQALIKQMTESTFDASAFDVILKSVSTVKTDCVSLSEESEQWEQEEDDGATRIELGERLYSLQKESGGLTGFWVVGGTPGVGKSTLAWQLALLSGERRRVLYYDLENTKRVLYRRTLEAMGNDVRSTHEALRRVYVRTNPHEIFREVQSTLVEPGVVIIDSLQKLPANVQNKRESLEQWLARLDTLKQEGHIIIVVSQLNRGEGDYKGTNDIEHTADFGIKMDADSANIAISNVYVEKNRHGAFRGFLCQLRRENTWLLKE